MDYKNLNNYEKIIAGCGISAFVNKDKKCVGGDKIIDSISLMRERGNGLGGGFAIYGCYPEYKDYYAIHCFYDDHAAADRTESFFSEYFYVDRKEMIPHRHLSKFDYHPIIRRYFIKPRVIREDTPDKIYENIEDDEYVFRRVMYVNSNINGAYVFSSGKNMGIFKGVGYPEDIAEFFKLENYKGYIWTAHNRFPTNSPSWWAGAHPFSILNYSVVHNGEISSYGINKRYLEMFNYKLELLTDTEVVVYLMDLFLRRHKLPIELVCKILSPPFWKDIEKLEDTKLKDIYKALRIVYGSAALNGPFGIILGFSEGIIGLNDRIKLRPLVAGEKDKTLFIASEESALRTMCADIDKIWHPDAGEPVIGLIE